MPLFWPEVGAADLITALIPTLNVTGKVKIGLFKNDYTPVFGSVLGSFTEADFTGYSQINVGDWGVGSDVASLRVQCLSAGPKVFTMTSLAGGTNNIYGYFIRHTDYGLLYAERAASPPLVMASVGQTLSVTPLFEFGNCG